MLRAIKFKQEYRCFKKGDKIEFRPGVNLMVGEQGTGKSTVFQCIRKNEKKICSLDADPVKMFSFDFEHDVSRGKAYFNPDMDMTAQVSMLFMSHGQSVKGIINALNRIDKDTKEPCLILMDEPDMALSIRSCYGLVDVFRLVVQKGHQVVASVHNPTVIRQFDEVLSLEHRRWMPSQEFITSHQPT
jgi:predicted ATPase